MTTKRYHTVTIPSGSAESDRVRLGDIETPCAVLLPDGFTGASIGVKAAYERDGSLFAVRGTDVTDTTALAISHSASTFVPLAFTENAGYVDLVFTSPSSEGADREFIVVTRQNGI